MNATHILEITKCGDLFPYGEGNVKAKYKELAKEWHPDTNRNENASKVFAKINTLYNKALQMIDDGNWEKTDYILITKDNGDKISLDYKTMFKFELGECYVADDSVMYILGSDKEKYYNNAIKQIRGLRYKDRDMEEKVSIFMPKIKDTFKTNKGEFVLSLEKTDDVYPLKNVLEHFGNKLDGKHVAWMITRLCNIACYLKYSCLVNNGINLQNCFVSPQYHSILLLGGWWYTTKENETMIGTSKEIFSVMSVASKSSKTSSSLTDLESIKLLARQLLGETNCVKLSSEKDIPNPFINYVIGGSSNDSYEEYAKWDRALNEAYGERKFLKMEIKNLYKREED